MFVCSNVTCRPADTTRDSNSYYTATAAAANAATTEPLLASLTLGPYSHASFGREFIAIPLPIFLLLTHTLTMIYVSCLFSFFA